MVLLLCRALTNFLSNLAILLPYFLYHRLIFLCPPLNQLFSSCLSLLINYGNLLIHVPCIFIWKLRFSILKIILWHPQMWLRLNFSPLWRVAEPRFIWVRKMKWNGILAPKCGGSKLALRVGNHRARKQSLYLMLLEDNDSRLRKWNWHWPKNG